MARPLIPLVRGGGVYPTRRITPLVRGNGLMRGGSGPQITWKTKSGTAPISFSDAMAYPLNSLIQEGKIALGGTPSMSSPKDITCNNGVLQLVDSELPSGYKRVASIKFDGDFWYDTGEQLHGSDDVTLTLDDTSTSGQNVFGSYNGTSTGTKNFSLYLYGGGSSSKCYLRYGDQLVRPQYGSGERTLTFGASGTDGFTVNVTVTPDTFTTESTAYIGMLPNSSSPAYTGTIVGNILVGTRLKYVPCERVSDGAVGYYETVKGSFIAPSGTGTPTKGAYDYSVSHSAVVGTPEVLTMGTQTAFAADLYALQVGNYYDTQDIISGTVTRNVGVKVFDGTETFTTVGGGPCYSDLVNPENDSTPVCTHFKGVAYSAQLKAGETKFFGSGRLIFGTTKTASEFTTWVGEQYAAGTPLIVLYALTTPVKERVRGQTLVTAEGSNTVSVTANVSGIKLTAEYAQAVEEP